MFICDICKKEYEDGKKYRGHRSSHFRGAGYKKNRKLLKLGDRNLIDSFFTCSFCSKSFLTGVSLGGHVASCKLNPKYNQTKEKIKLKLKGKTLTIEQKNKLSIAMKLAVKEGRQKTPRPGGILTGSWYMMKNDQQCYLHGSWEIAVAKFMDSKNINWIRNKTGFPYLYIGSIHSYFPDFYLPDFNFYIEVKGYETDKDHEKWKQFPNELKIIRYKEYINLELWYQQNIGPLAQLVRAGHSCENVR
jgi:hypothetical protein